MRWIVFALLLAPGVHAELAVEAVDAQAWSFPPGQTTLVPLRVTTDCISLAAAIVQGHDGRVAVAVDLPPAWNASAGDVTFDIDRCAGNTTVARETTIGVTPTAAAIGLAPRSLVVNATGIGENASFTYPEDVQVAYRGGHVLRPDLTFPVTVEEEPLQFVLLVEFTANAPSMIMFENVDGGGGTLTGLGGDASNFEPGDGTKVFHLQWKPPTGSWRATNITFEHYSHCMAGPGCEGPTNTEVWQVLREGEAPPAAQRAAPGLAPWALLCTLMAAGAVARPRRRRPRGR